MDELVCVNPFGLSNALELFSDTLEFLLSLLQVLVVSFVHQQNLNCTSVFTYFQEVLFVNLQLLMQIYRSQLLENLRSKQIYLLNVNVDGASQKDLELLRIEEIRSF